MSGGPRASFKAARAGAVRRPPPAPLGEGWGPYDRGAAAALAFADFVADIGREPDLPRLLREARARLDGFADALVADGQPRPAVGAARLALGLVIDRAARNNQAIPPGRWAAGAHRLLFEGEDMSVARLRDFLARAEAAGPAYAGAAEFLQACLAHLEAERSRVRRPGGDSWAANVLSGVLGFALLVLGWAAHSEWSFHREALADFRRETAPLGLDRGPLVRDLTPRLDRMAAAVEGLEDLLGLAPVRLFAGPMGFDAAEAARAARDKAVARQVPPVLARGIMEALKDEGEGAALYDALRAWNVLSGREAWSADYLAGWTEAQAARQPGLRGLAPHVRRLASPGRGLEPPDPATLDQAKDLAREAPEAERAWIELIRSPEMAALDPWQPAAAVPDLAVVAERRSQQPVGAPVPGAFTAAGWAVARDGGAAEAVRRAREEAQRLLGEDLPRSEDAAGLVMLRLQEETLATWENLLADLRVRPLGEGDEAVRITGPLARNPSPVETLLRAAWIQAGGGDPERPQAFRLRVATRFGPAIRYTEQGGLKRISELLGALNATFGARDLAPELRSDRLAAIELQAVRELEVAPPVVVQIMEDALVQTAVVSQTAEARVADLANPLAVAWQSEVLELCRRTTEGRFPFALEGPDADPADFAALLAPGGVIDRFVENQAAPYLDMTATPWRWRPEARFQGLSPEGAILLQRAQSITSGFFGPSATLETELRLAALTQAAVVVTVGGTTTNLPDTGEEVVLAWPGPTPAQGMAVAFPGRTGASLSQPGPWGMMRLFGAFRLRERDGGLRFRVDLRAGDGRVFVDVTFPSADNPLARLDQVRGFTCPAGL